MGCCCLPLSVTAGVATPVDSSLGGQQRIVRRGDQRLPGGGLYVITMLGLGDLLGDGEATLWRAGMEMIALDGVDVLSG